MKACAPNALLAPASFVQVPGARRLSCAPGPAEPLGSTPPLECLLPIHTTATAPRKKEAASIFMVDDTEGITDLYHIFLHGAGYIVRSFDSRAVALEALTLEPTKPDLLIMDYRGDAMPADRFIQRCRSIHPALRILMASGLSQNEARFSCVRPDRFIQKPFTAEEFQEEVRAALNGS